ncbi:MAG: adenylate kinase [Candidatus Sericytochromatia bacterium]|nr:adenylate kinase [Candidatus Sericytochromatia bacterium]
MRMIFLGAPGAGKGTQARIVAEKHGLPQIATGNILRQAVKDGTTLGQEAKSFMDAGGLVPDGVMIGLIHERLQQPDAQKGWILDGFPRTQAQAEALDALLAKVQQDLDLVVDVQVPDAEIVGRLGGRWVCKQCEAPYHSKNNPPKTDKVCDHCGGELYQRADDKPDTVASRLTVYHTNTSPLIGYYQGRGNYRAVDGTQPIETVERALEAILAGVSR